MTAKRTLLNQRVSALIGRRIPDGPDGYQAALRKLERDGGLDTKLMVELLITLLAHADVHELITADILTGLDMAKKVQSAKTSS